MKERSFSGEAIKGWRFYHWIDIGTGMRPTPVIGDGEKNVGWRFFGGELRFEKTDK
jgi:hypothetical protein